MYSFFCSMKHFLGFLSLPQSGAEWAQSGGRSLLRPPELTNQSRPSLLGGGLAPKTHFYSKIKYTEANSAPLVIFMFSLDSELTSVGCENGWKCVLNHGRGNSWSSADF